MGGRAQGSILSPGGGLDSDDKGTDSCGRGQGVTVWELGVEGQMAGGHKEGKVFLAEGTASAESQRLCSGTCQEQERAEGVTLEEEGEISPSPSMPLEGGDWVLLWDGTVGVIPGLHQYGVEETCTGNNGVPGGTGGVGINRSLGPDVQVGEEKAEWGWAMG